MVPLDVDEDRGGYAFIQGAVNLARVAGTSSDEQIAVERASEEGRVRDDGRSAWRQAVDPATNELRARRWETQLIERAPFPACAGVPDAAVVDEGTEHL